MKKLKLGVVGLGRVASKTHIPVLRTFDNVELVTGAESNKERAERIKDLFSFKKVYTDYEDMYTSEQLDGVYICLPNYLHKDACKKALENGINVLCEKPMGISLEESDEITSIAHDKGLILMPGYKKRYAENFTKAKNIIHSGLLGNIVHVQGTFITPGPYISWDPKSDWYLDEKFHGVIYDSGCHLIDLLLYLVPQDVSSAHIVHTNGFNGYNTPTNVCSVFKMDGGIIGDLSIGWRGSTDILSLSIHGTAGSIMVNRDNLVYLNPGTDPVDRIMSLTNNIYLEIVALVKKVSDKVKGMNFYSEDLQQATAFCNAISGEIKAPISGVDASRTHKFLELMISSKKN